MPLVVSFFNFFKKKDHTVSTRNIMFVRFRHKVKRPCVYYSIFQAKKKTKKGIQADDQFSKYALRNDVQYSVCFIFVSLAKKEAAKPIKLICVK